MGSVKRLAEASSDALEPAAKKSATAADDDKVAAAATTTTSSSAGAAAGKGMQEPDGQTKLKKDEYRERLKTQGKYEDLKPGARTRDACLKDPPDLPPQVQIFPKRASLPKRDEKGTFIFPDFPEFKPNLSPEEVMKRGSFGGSYFRNISSAVTGKKYSGKEVIAEFPKEWFEGLNLDTQVCAPHYDKKMNYHKVSCGGSLGMWETSGWISAADPYGWFHWYCRFFLGRRSSDDARQVDRWMKGQGPTGRWRIQLMNKIIKAKAKFDDAKISPVIRQVLIHWAYELTDTDLTAHVNK